MDEAGDEHLNDDTPAGYIDVGDELMAYWTRDGRLIEEIWAEERTSDDELPF